MRKSSRGVLEEKKRHKALLEQVTLVPRTETSRWMWMVMHMDTVLMEGVTCDTIREFLYRCERKGNVQNGLQGQQSNVACMVALGLHACSHSERDVGYWFGLEGDGVRFISCVWMCGLQSWILRMLPWFEQERRFFLSMCVLDVVLLHSDAFGYQYGEDNHTRDRIVLDPDNVELVCCSLHFVIIRLLDGMEAADDMARLVGLVDNSLMVLSGIEDSSGGLFRWQKRIMVDIARLNEWIDEQCCEGSLESSLYRLKSRLMLFEYKRVSDTTKSHDDGCCTLLNDDELKEIEDTRSSVITLMRAAFDSVLHWSAVPNDASDEYIAYACWSVSNTLFLEQTSISNHHPSPVADYKILCNTLDRLVVNTETSDCETLEQIACWALSSHVDDVQVQQQLVDLYREKLNSSPSHLESIEDRHVSLQHEWVRHQMLSMGNKLAMDDTSAGGIVVGKQLEARMKTIRNLVFPAVLLCPYSLLHKLFNASLTNRNEVWILSSICEVFPNLVRLRPVDCSPISENQIGTELSRLLVDKVITSKSISEEEESSLLYMVEVFMNATPSILSLGMFRNDILPMLSSPEDASPEFATKFVKRILELSSLRSICDLLLSEESDTSSPYAVVVLETCMYYLEFDNRYQSLGISKHDGINSDVISSYFDKLALQNIQDIVLLVAECLMECDASYAQHILTTVEYQGHPWARLYFGIDFTEDEAHYILKLNPKHSHLEENCFGVKNTTFHQAFELAALGSIQAQMLKHLAHEYKSIDDLRGGIVRSVSCIASVCTSSEAQHLLHGVEVIAGEICIGAQNTSVSNALAKPYILQACTRAIVAEIGIKSVHNMVDHTYYAQASMALSDVGRYCLQSISELAPSTSPILALRLFGEVLQCYTSLTTLLKEKSLHPTSIQSSSIEAIISSLAQSIVREHSRALSEQENSIIVNRASDMVNQASLNDTQHNTTQYMTALRSLFKT